MISAAHMQGGQYLGSVNMHERNCTQARMKEIARLQGLLTTYRSPPHSADHKTQSTTPKASITSRRHKYTILNDRALYHSELQQCITIATAACSDPIAGSDLPIPSDHCSRKPPRQSKSSRTKQIAPSPYLYPRCPLAALAHQSAQSNSL